MSATPTELSAVMALTVEQESPFSGAPMYRPEASGALLLGLALGLSPKEPKERAR